MTLLSASVARGQDVEVLMVGESKSYLAAARAAAAGLGRGIEPVTLTVDDPLPARWQQWPPQVVIAVGARAVRLALTLPETRIVAAMVLQESRELQSERVHAVPLAVSLRRQLQLLERLSPKARRIGLVMDPRHSGAAVNEAKAAVVGTGRELVLREVQDSAQVMAAFEEVLASADAVLLVADTTVVRREVLANLVLRSLKLRVPIIGYSAAVVQTGLLAGYSVEPEENGLAAAAMARDLLARKTPKPPAQQGQLHLNLKTARLIGVTVPADLAAPPTNTYDPR